MSSEFISVFVTVLGYADPLLRLELLGPATTGTAFRQPAGEWSG
jgi:hypothetical protein